MDHIQTFEIRRARLEDQTAIHEAHMRSIREVCIKDHGEEEIRGWGYRTVGERWKKPIQQGTVWVIERYELIYGVAYIDVQPVVNLQPAHIHALYLVPEALKQGLGSMMLGMMCEEAREHGAKSITLDSSLTAYRFYKHHGFQEYGPLKWTEIGGYPVRSYPMHLLLEASDG